MHLVYTHFGFLLYTPSPLFGLVVDFYDGAVLLVHEVSVHLFQFPEGESTMGISYI